MDYHFNLVLRIARSVGQIAAHPAFIILIAGTLLVTQTFIVYAAQGDAISLRRVSDSVVDIAKGDGAKSGSLEEMESEMFARVHELINSDPFKVNDSNGEYLPAQLVELMHYIVEQSPMLKMERARIAALEQKVAMAGAPMDPKVGLKVMDLPAVFPWDLEDSMIRQEFSISQMFFSYGKRSSRERIAAYDVELQKLKVAQAEYNLAGEMIAMYYKYARVEVELQTLDRRDALLEVMENIARVRYELGKAPLADVLMIQTEREMLVSMRQELMFMHGEIVSEMAGMIGIPDNKLIVKLIDIPWFEPIEVVDAESLWQATLSRHPENKWLKVLLEQTEERLSLAKKDYHPDYEMEFDYTYSYEMDDRVSLEVIFNLPIYQKRMQDSAYKEVSAMKAEVSVMQDELLNRIRSKGQIEVSCCRLILPKIEQYRKALIPLAKTTFDAVLAGYQVNMMGLSELIQAQEALVNFEGEMRLALVDGAESRAKLYYITLGAVVDATDGINNNETNNSMNGGSEVVDNG